MYLGVIAGMILLYLIYSKMTQKTEYTEQLTVEGVVLQEESKTGHLNEK
jgi:hypothetical protein